MAAYIVLTYPLPLYPLVAPQVPAEGVAFSRMASMLHCRLQALTLYCTKYPYIYISIYHFFLCYIDQYIDNVC